MFAGLGSKNLALEWIPEPEASNIGYFDAPGIFLEPAPIPQGCSRKADDEEPGSVQPSDTSHIELSMAGILLVGVLPMRVLLLHTVFGVYITGL